MKFQKIYILNLSRKEFTGTQFRRLTLCTFHKDILKRPPKAK